MRGERQQGWQQSRLIARVSLSVHRAADAATNKWTSTRGDAKCSVRGTQLFATGGKVWGKRNTLTLNMNFSQASNIFSAAQGVC